MAFRRISIVGSTGSGKTFLARELSGKLSLPHIELDKLRKAAERTGRENESFREAIELAVAGESWIIDGYYRRYRQLVWQHADLVMHLDFALPVVARQLLKRYVANRLQRSSKVGTNFTTDSAGTRQYTGTASWPRRVRRLARTFAERREYAKVLQISAIEGLRVVRYRSQEEAVSWIQSLR